MVKKSIKRGDKVVLARPHSIFIERTAAEFQALRDKDTAAGRWHDDGGEPILYGPYSSWNTVPDLLLVTVTSLRPKWLGWGRRPKGLVQGFSEKLNREILFIKAV